MSAKVKGVTLVATNMARFLESLRSSLESLDCQF